MAVAVAVAESFASWAFREPMAWMVLPSPISSAMRAPFLPAAMAATTYAIPARWKGR